VYRAVLRPEPTKKLLKPSYLAYANIDLRYAEGSLDLISDDAWHKQAVLDYYRNMHVLEKSGIGLIISGSVGTGKSTIGCQLLMRAMLSGPVRCYYVDAAEIPSIAIDKPVTEEGESVWALLRGDAHFLVIDDLGNDKSTDWKDTVFRRVLNGRYGKCVPTIITTNLEREALFRLVIRLKELFCDAYKWITVDGPTWRENDEEASR
jgi:DNA replication protein DnaC